MANYKPDTEKSLSFEEKYSVPASGAPAKENPRAEKTAYKPDTDKSRRFLAKYGMAEYTQEEKDELQNWANLAKRGYGNLQGYVKQLDTDDWASLSKDGYYRRALGQQIQEAQGYLKGLKKDSVTYKDASEYLANLQEIQKAFADRGDYYGQFKDEEEFNILRGISGARAEAKKKGESYNDYYLRTEQGAARADEAFQAAQQKKAQMQQDVNNQRQYLSRTGILLVDGRVLRGKAAEDYLQQRQNEVNSVDQEIQQRAKEAEYARKVSGYAKAGRYADLQDLPDYEQLLAAGGRAWEEEHARLNAGKTSERDIAINANLMPNNGLGGVNLAAAAQVMRNDTSSREPQEDWTEQERNTFLILFQRSPEEAYDYAIEINSRNANASYADKAKALSDWTNENGWRRAAAWGAGILSQPFAAADYLDRAMQYGVRGYVMPHSELTPADAADTMSAAASRYLNENHRRFADDIPVLGGKGWGDVFQLSQSIAQSAAAASLGGGATNLLFFGSAANQGFQDAKGRGASDGEALILGFLNGSAEVLGETISVDKLIKIKNPATIRRYLWNVAKQGGIEASEETFTTILNSFADSIVMGDKSELQQNIRQLMAQGMSRAEAEKQAWQEWTEGLAGDALGGFLSGGISAGGRQAVGMIRSNAIAYSGEDAQRLVEVGLEQKEGSAAYKLAQKIQEQGTMSELEAQRLTDLLGEDAEAIHRNQRAELVQEAQRRLQEAGLGQRSAARSAETVTRELLGEELDRAGRADRERDFQNETVRQVARQMEQERGTEALQRYVQAQADRTEKNSGKKVNAQLQRAFRASGIKLSEHELEILTDGFIPGSNRVNSYVIAARDGYRLGKSGMTLEQAAKSSDYAGKVMPLQFRHAWELGMQAAGGTVTESGTGPSKESTVQIKGQEGSSRILGLTRSADGQLQARVAGANGGEQTVSLSEIDLGESGLDELVDALKGRADAEQIFSAYHGGLSVGSYIRAWDTAKAYGQATGSRTVESVLQDSMLEGMDEASIRAAFAYGREQQKAKRAERGPSQSLRDSSPRRGESQAESGEGKGSQGARKGGVSYDGGTVDGVKLRGVNRNRLTPKQRAQIRVVDALGLKFGIEFRLFESSLGKNGRYQSAYGMYKDGVIYLDVNAGRLGQSMGQVALVRTAAHELTHYIQDYAEERYQELQEFLLDYLAEWKGKDLGQLVAEKMQRDRTGKLTPEEALDEVVADGCEMMLRRTKVMQAMAEQKPGLFQAVKEWMQEWIQAVKEAFLGVSEVHDEARAVAQMETERLEKLVELWDKGLMEGSERAAKSPAREGGAVRYSFAGERALTADRDQLQRAQQLEKQNADSEQIRQETGWFRGLDGKWRFEIDDSGMQLFRGGDAQFAKDHPEYGEYKELLNKVILGTANAEEMARVKELEETWGRELPRLSQRVKLGGATLENIIQHDRLFAAYPELRSMRVRFADLGRGVNGEYSRKANAIILNENIRNKDNGTILHEIQHAIQKIEGFTPGASKEYWEEQLRNGYEDERRSEEYKAADKKYRDLLEAAPAKLKEKLRELDRAKSDGDVDALDRISEELYEGPFADKFIEIDQADYERRRIFYSEKDSLAEKLYFNTAGEIEARDTADRAGSSEAERKSTRPDLNRRGVVFAESENSFTIDLSGEKQGENHGLILDAIRAHFSEIVNDEAVAELTGEEFGRVPGDNRPLKNKVQDYFDSLGNKVHREGFGDIGLNSAGVHDSLQHGYGRLKAMTFAALPEVLKKGKMVDADPNHELHPYDSFLIMAPVTIREGAIKGRCYVGAIVMRDSNTKRYKIHEVLTTRENGTSSDKSEAHQIGSGLRYDVPSEKSILPESENSKPKFQEREDLPDDRALLMQARAEGRNAESLTAYQKKVRSLEALERKLHRQQDGLEAARKHQMVDHEGKPLSPEEQKKFTREAVKNVQEQIRKTEEQIRRAEKALADMERKPEMRQELENALAAWREANPNDAARAIRQMQQERDSLREYVKLLGQEARLTTPETRRMLPSDIRKLARNLVKEGGSNAAVEEIAEQLQQLGDFMVEHLEGADTGYFNQVTSMARKIAEKIVSESYETLDENKETREGIRSYLREHTLRISDDVRGDIPDFNAWRKKQMGTLWMGKDGLDIDVAYHDLQASYGVGLFPEDIYSRADQLDQILEALDQVQPTYQQMFSRVEQEQAAAALGNEIVDRLLSKEVREKDSMADRAFQQRMKQLEEKYARKDRARQQALENAEDRAFYERIKRDEAEERRKEERALRRQLVAEKVHELRERSIERDKKYRGRIAIDKKVVALSKIMLENSGKRHVPDAWKETIGDFLSSIDTLTEHSSEKSRAFHIERVEALQKMVRKQIAANRGEEGGEGTNGFFLINPLIEEMLDPFVKLARESDTGKITLTKLSLEQLQELEEIMVTLRKAVDTSNEIISLDKKQEVSALAEKTLSYVEPLGEAKGLDKVWKRRLRKYTQFDNLTPVYYFKMLGQAGEEIFRSLQNGQGREAFNVKQIIAFTNGTKGQKGAYTEDEVKSWEKETHEFQLVKRESDLSGRESLTKAAAESGPEGVKEAEEKNKSKVTLSTAQIMGLYCLARREQARGHILGGGIRIWDIEAKSGTKTQADRYLVKAEDIAAITASLTDRQKEVANALQKYMNTVGSSWGNEVSRKLYGVDLFTEENYYPIETDPKSRAVKNPDADNTDLFRLANMGFTKSTVKNADNGVVLHSIFDVFSAHMSDMARYNAMCLPVIDAMKWFNYLDEGENHFTSVRGAIEKAYGVEAEKYFLTLIQDINGYQAGRGDYVGGKMVSNAKVAAVGANLRVAFLQPTSYVRAMAVLDPKYMGKISNLKIKQGIEEAMQYSGTANWKDLGFFDLNVNANVKDLIKHADTTMDKIKEGSMWLAEKGDRWTWGALWNATKAEVQDKTGLTGEALMKATAERFDDVIYQTQVMDSVLTRSQMMRKKDGFHGMVTSFMAEPTLSYNLLLNSLTEWENAKRSGKGTQEARRKIARAFTVYALSQIVASFVESIFDALRDDDDYESFLEKWLQAEIGKGGKFMDGNLMQDLAPWSKLPYLRDLVSIWQGFTNKRMDTEWMNYWATAIKALVKDWTPNEKGEVNGFTWSTAYKTMRALSTTTGLPIGNSVREVMALWNGFVVQNVPGWKLKTWKTTPTKPEASIKQAFQAGALSEEDAIRYLMRDAEIETEEKARQKLYEWGLEKGTKKYDKLLNAVYGGKDSKAARDELLQAGFSEDSLRSEVRSAVKAWYQGTAEDGRPRIEKDAAIRMLVKEGGMSQRDAEAKVREWSSYVSSPEKLQYEDVQAAYIAGEITAARAAEMRMLYGGKSKSEAQEEVLQWQCERDTGIAYSDLKDAWIDGEISDSEAVEYQMKYGGQTKVQAQQALQQWRYVKDTGGDYSDVKQGFLEGSISEQDAIDARVDYGGQTRIDAEKEIRKWSCEKETGIGYDDMHDLYLSGELSAERAAQLQQTYGGQTKTDAQKEVRKWTCEKETGIVYDDLQDLYLSGEVSAERASQLRVTYGGQTKIDADSEVLKWRCEKETGIRYSEMEKLFIGGELSGSRAADLRVKYGGQSKEKAEEEVLHWQCEKDTGIRYKDIRDAYAGGQISEEKVRQMLQKYGGYSETEAEGKALQYRFAGKDAEMADISPKAATTYYGSLEAAGVSKEVWYKTWRTDSTTQADKKANGKAISGSKKNKMVAYIHSLNLTPAQKDALYLALDYAKSGIRNTPWH